MSAAASQSLKKMHSLSETLKLGLDDSPASEPLKRSDALLAGRIPYRELVALYEETNARLKQVSNEKDEIANLAHQRQEAFMRTEDKYREDMRLLEVRLQEMGLEDRSRMEPLRDLHSNLQDTINSIQTKTARVLQDQERDLIRAFRARLADVTVELENERKKNESGSAEWVARCRKLTEELEWLRDLTDKLTSENKAVLKDNRRFKRQMKTQEEDREFLIAQLTTTKKENARLRYSFDQLMQGGGAAAGANGNGQMGATAMLAPGSGSDQPLLPPGTGTVSSITGRPMTAKRQPMRAGSTGRSGSISDLPSRPHSAMVQPSGGFGTRPSTAGSNTMSRPVTAGPVPSMAGSGDFAEKEARYKALVNKLQRQVEDGAKSYRQLRTQYTQELAGRTELQSFVKKCIDDVRQDMADRGRSATLRRAQGAHRATSAGALRTKQPLPPPLDPRTIPLSEFTPQDRINVMEWLLAQDSVIFMLYEKIFPQRGGGSQNSQAAEAAAAQREFDAQQPPGSLFAASMQQARPSSSPVQQFGGGVQATRPHTVGPGQMRSGGIGGSSSSQSSSTSSLPSVGTAGVKAGQYERPLGRRPLSGGFEHDGTVDTDAPFHLRESASLADLSEDEDEDRQIYEDRRQEMKEEEDDE